MDIQRENGMLKQDIFNAGAGIKTMPAFYPRTALIGWETLPPCLSVGVSEGKKKNKIKNFGTETQTTPPAFVSRHHHHTDLYVFVHILCILYIMSYLNALYCVRYGSNNA